MSSVFLQPLHLFHIIQFNVLADLSIEAKVVFKSQLVSYDISRREPTGVPATWSY